MPAEVRKEIQLEIAHVLFIDIVGYSKLSINEQHAAVDKLTQIVRATEQFQKAEAANCLIKIATGDGMALVFYTSPEAPVRHILLSKHVAEDLEEYEQWRPLLHDLGSCEVKHGMRVAVVNLYSEQIGNPRLPSKLQAVRKHRAHVRWAEIAAALLVLCVIIAGVFFLAR